MFALFTEDGLDQVCSTSAEMRKEAKDLQAMGYTVWFYELAEGFDVEAWASDNYGKRPKRPNIIGGGKLTPKD